MIRRRNAAYSSNYERSYLILVLLAFIVIIIIISGIETKGYFNIYILAIYFDVFVVKHGFKRMEGWSVRESGGSSSCV